MQIDVKWGEVDLAILKYCKRLQNNSQYINTRGSHKILHLWVITFGRFFPILQSPFWHIPSPNLLIVRLADSHLAESTLTIPNPNTEL